MPLMFLGFIVSFVGGFLYRKGFKDKSREMENGAIALLLAGLFLLLWGIVLVFTGSLGFSL